MQESPHGLRHSCARPLVSYVLITRNRKDEVLRCLASIVKQDYTPSEIVLVDNHSQDNTLEAVRTQYPRVRVIALDYNAGVAGGRNVGMEAARGDLIVCVDDDAILTTSEAIRRVVDVFRNNESVGIVALRIMDGECAHPQKSAIPTANKHEPENLDEVCYYCGAGHAIRREMLAQIGLYPERYFRGAQELALSYKALDAGWRIVYLREMEVQHNETPTARARGQRTYFYTRSRLWLPLQFLPWRYALPHCSLWMANMAVEALRRAELAYFILGLRDMMRGLPAVLEDRQVVSKRTIQILQRCSGRIWR